MKTTALLSAVLALTLPAVSSAQLTVPNGAKSDAIQLKMYKIELLAQIMPLALTREQIRLLLPTIEKIRGEQRKTMQVEADTLAKQEEALDKALKAALDKGELPPREIQGNILKVRQVLALQRTLLLTEFVDQMTAKMKEVLNPGQWQVMVKTVDPKQLNSAKPDDVKDDDRAKAYVRVFILEPVTYDLLVEMSKPAS